MGDFLVPLLILVIVGALVLVASSFTKKKSGSSKGLLAGVKALREPVTAEHARDAAAKLSAENHKQIYGLIARGNHQGAAETYAQITGTNILQAAAAIAALSTYPQNTPSGDKSAAVSEAERDLSDVVEFGEEDHQLHDDDALPELPIELTEQNFRIPAEWQDQHPQENTSFELQVSRQDETLRISSDDLGPWVQEQLSAMVRDNNVEHGTQLLLNNTELNEAEARQFLEIMIERKRGQDTDD